MKLLEKKQIPEVSFHFCIFIFNEPKENRNFENERCMDKENSEQLKIIFNSIGFLEIK